AASRRNEAAGLHPRQHQRIVIGNHAAIDKRKSPRRQHALDDVGPAWLFRLVGQLRHPDHGFGVAEPEVAAGDEVVERVGGVKWPRQRGEEAHGKVSAAKIFSAKVSAAKVFAAKSPRPAVTTLSTARTHWACAAGSASARESAAAARWSCCCCRSSRCRPGYRPRAYSPRCRSGRS